MRFVPFISDLFTPSKFIESIYAIAFECTNAHLRHGRNYEYFDSVNENFMH